MKKVVLILIVLLQLHFSSSAQLNFKGGVNIAAQFNGYGGVSTYGTTKPGYHLGVTYEFHHYNSVFLRTGLQYSLKGNKIPSRRLSITNRMNYLELPLDIVYATKYVSMHTGFYTAYLVSAEFEGSKDKSVLTPFDLGLNFGLSFKFNDFGLGLNYGYGIVDASKNIFDTRFLRNKVFSVFFTYAQ